MIRLFPDRIVLQERADFGKGLREQLSDSGGCPGVFDGLTIVFAIACILAWSVYLVWYSYK